MAFIPTKKFKIPDYQLLYPDKKIIDYNDLTPGSIIEIDGYTLSSDINYKGEKINYPVNSTITQRHITQNDVRPPLRCAVRRVIITMSESETYIVVETDVEYSKKEQEILRLKYHAIGISHINRIIHKEPASTLYKVQINTFCDLHIVLANKLQTLDPYHCFDLRAIAIKGVKDKVFYQSRTTIWPFTETKYSKKRLSTWLKQNINRFKQKEYLLKL